MLVNLPAEFSRESLNYVSWGDVDAKRDEALSSLMYVSNSNTLKRFKSGKYSIVVGEKGAGKTAIFRLYKDEQVHINDKSHNTISDFIEAGIDLSLYDSLVDQYIHTARNSKNNDILKYQITWEIFFIYRLLFIIDKENMQLTPLLKEAKKNFDDFLLTGESKGNILDFLKSFSLKNNVTVSTINPEQITFSTEITNSGKNSEKNSDKVLQTISVNLALYKSEINELLKLNNTVIRIFIDKLDDFVTKENYDYQKKFLQSLLYIEEDFFDTEFLKIHIFLRKDLYDRLDKTSLGPDKIESRKIDLSWNRKEILEFLARRILYIYNKCFDLTKFEFEIDEKPLYVEEKALANQLENETGNNNLWGKIKEKIPDKIKKVFKKNYQKLPKRSRYLNDQFYEDIIYSLFPKKVVHFLKDGTKQDLDFVDYLLSHTALASGKTNPRMVIMFCETLFEEVLSYYENNPDLNIPCVNGSFRLIPEELFVTAYPKYQQKIFDIFRQYDFKKNDYFVELAKAISSKRKIKESELIVKMKIPTQSKAATDVFNRNLAFFVSLGVLGTDTYIKDHSNREYNIPIVFQKSLKK